MATTGKSRPRSSLRTWTTSELDHRYLNELEPFTRINPTAENIAAHFFKELSSQLNSSRIRVQAVTLWETERACVRYAEDES